MGQERRPKGEGLECHKSPEAECIVHMALVGVQDSHGKQDSWGSCLINQGSETKD